MSLKRQSHFCCFSSLFVFDTMPQESELSSRTIVAKRVLLKHPSCCLKNVHSLRLSRLASFYLRPIGNPLPKNGSFFCLRMVFNMRRIITYCFNSSFTSFSLVPEPLATRFIREALKIFGFSFSAGVMD